MRHIFKIISAIGSFIIGIYISTLELPIETKIIIWILCALVIVSSIGKEILDWKKERAKEHKEKKDEKVEDYYHREIEEIALRQSGLPAKYIDGLGEHPKLQHFINTAEDYEREHKYNEAIEEYKKCLFHPKAKTSHKVAANILAGNCYYSISKLNEAMNLYKEALKLAKSIKDKVEKQKAKSIALGNIGIIYSDLGKPEEALKYHKEALEIDRKIGYEQGIASDLGNIGLIYRDLGKLRDALTFLKESLDIFKEIKAESEIKIAEGIIKRIVER